MILRRSLPFAFVSVSALFACPAGDDGDDATEGADDVADDGTPTTAGDDGGTTPADSSGSGELPNECPFNDDVEPDTTDGQSNPLMNMWSSACTEDADCVALLGEGAYCEDTAVIYELPGGYCTKPCDVPTGMTVVLDDPACDPAGGVNCVGVDGFFEACVPSCTDDAQCNRAGYYCRQMPMIANPDDPSFCLMPDCCEETCAE
jgi:hypothetical protein